MMTKKLFPIPGYNGLYSITKDGDVFGHKTGRFLSRTSGVFDLKCGRVTPNSLLVVTFGLPKGLFPVPGHEGRYSITKKGEIFSFFSNRFLRPTRCKRGYLKVGLNGKTHTRGRVVALTFIENPLPLFKTQVNHIDGDKTNDSIENLEWVTPSENMRHAYSAGLMEGFITALKGNIGGKKQRRLTFDSVEEIRALHRKARENGEMLPYKAIARKYKTSSGTITSIVHNRSYKDA